MKKIIYSVIFLLSAIINVNAEDYPNKKVLVLMEGDYVLAPKAYAAANGRQMAQLLGHFNTTVTIEGLNHYKAHEIEKYDYVFYVGYSPAYQVSAEFCKDVFSTSKTVTWINAGFIDFCKKQNVEKRYGFTVSQFDQKTPFSFVKADDAQFNKGTPDMNIIQIKNKSKVEVWATALSIKPKKEVPYMVRSGNLIYVADMPFTDATETDRYLYFADKLHDILKENHPEQHQAIIRIEDVTPLNDPNKLREVADILAARGIPFLVGVVPIYVNPSEDRRVTLTERPDVVDALKYMVRNGGSIVMHGVTHQYKGVSTDDCEFWDSQTEKPIPEENPEDVSKKIDMGIDEFFKNGLYPIAWETPHYEASVKSYEVFTKFFSTAVEQRMVIDNFDYSQYFPYIINKDLYGQKIYPENLGYIPLNANFDTSMTYVNRIIKNTAMIHKVRDGISSFFFHPFLDLSLLKELVDGVKSKGFTFMDLGNQTHWVKAHDKVILTGTQTYEMNIDNAYLYEVYFDTDGNIIKKTFSPERMKGKITKKIVLKPGELYIAEGLDYYIKEPTFKEVVVQKVRSTYRDLFADKNWHEAKVCICWNQYAKGAAYYDQSSLASMFKSVNINVDTIFLGQDLTLDNTNLLVVPYSYVDSLTYFDYRKITRYLKNGGNLITDRRNKLSEKLGIKFFANSEMKLHMIRDKYFPQEFISWKYIQLADKFEYDENDEVLCEDASTGLPVAIGRPYGKGKFIFFNTAFDPFTPSGYSNYPFAMDYVKRYLKLYPIFKRENLEFYFEPVFRKNTSVENLVKLWVKQGIRIVHIGGWLTYDKYTYDYKRLIRLAHANGILVYVWLEPPYVSEKFWKAHPEWREKNYKNKDLNDPDPAKNASWRYMMALTDNECLKAVMTTYEKLLKDYDWDGVNLAELSFEAGPQGFKQPNWFAPMHPTACAEFKKDYGFDMRHVFDSTSVHYWKINPDAKADVINYRVDKITELHDKFLNLFTGFAKTKPGFGIIVTFYDTYFSPELKENHGINADDMINLQKKFGFMLQPEDPQNKWSTDPSRYEEMGKLYAKKVSDPSKLMLDLNILNFRRKDGEVTPFPTLIQTGIESYLLINSAALGAPRFTVYSEGSCNPQDLSLFAYASSGRLKYKSTDDGGYEVNSPFSFTLQLPQDYRIIKVDDQSVVGYRENCFIIPAGEHTLNLRTSDIPGFSSVEIQPQILSFTGNLLDIKYGMRQLNFIYESTERALVSINRQPTEIKVDGTIYPFEEMRGNDCFTVFLPVGKHLVEIVTGDKFTYGMNITSLWSISAIAIYGTIAVALLVLMYLVLKIFRKRLER